MYWVSGRGRGSAFAAAMGVSHSREGLEVQIDAVGCLLMCTRSPGLDQR